MQKQNPIIKNYIISSKPYIIKDKQNQYIKKCNNAEVIVNNKNLY